MAKNAVRGLFNKKSIPLLVGVIALIMVFCLFNLQNVPQTSPEISEAFNNPSDSFTSCYIMNTAFPPSNPNANPPLPPLNPLPYLPPKHVCKEFAFEFCDTLELFFPEVSCEMIYFDKHTANLIRYTDSSGQRWVCVVEPQTNEYYCIPEEEFNRLKLKEWLRETLCKQYYPIPDDDCEKYLSGILGICEEIIGKTCAERNEFTRCYRPSTHEAPVLKCVCKNIFSNDCTWKELPFKIAENVASASLSQE